MSRQINVTKDQILSLMDQGYTRQEIADKFGCCYDLISRRLKSDDDLLPVRTCYICGSEFRGGSKRQTCGSADCQREHAKRCSAERSKAYHDRVKEEIRNPVFTPTLDRMLVEDMSKGRSAAWMAQMYNRPKKDIQARIDELKAEGRADRIQSRLSEYARRA